MSSRIPRSGRTLGHALLCALLLPLSACTVAAGGGVAAALLGVAALTSHCYDHLDVTVLDAEGRKTCAAQVTATKGNDRFELTSCYYGALTDGTWTLRASLPGHADAASTVIVEHQRGCTRNVQSVELTLHRALPQAPPLLPQPPPLPAPPPPPPSSVATPPAAATAESASPPPVSSDGGLPEHGNESLH